MHHPHEITPNFNHVLRSGTKLLEKVICVFDDIPFLLQNVLPKSAESIGTFMLAGAGFVVFPLELAEGVTGLKKARKKHPASPERKVLMTTNLCKITFASSGILISGGLLAFMLASKTLAATITSPLIPIVISMIVAVELKQKSYKLQLAKERHNVKDIIAGERQVGFATTYFACSLAVAGLAVAITLSNLGILSLGIIPSVTLVSVVVVAVAIKIFELIDKKKDFKFTQAINAFFNPQQNSPETLSAERNTQSIHTDGPQGGWCSFFYSKQERVPMVREIKGLELKTIHMIPSR